MSRREVAFDCSKGGWQHRAIFCACTLSPHNHKTDIATYYYAGSLYYPAGLVKVCSFGRSAWVQGSLEPFEEEPITLRSVQPDIVCTNQWCRN